MNGKYLHFMREFALARMEIRRMPPYMRRAMRIAVLTFPREEKQKPHAVLSRPKYATEAKPPRS